MFTAAQIARQTGIPKRTVIHAITSGKLRAKRVGGEPGIFLAHQKDVDRWLATRELSSNQEESSQHGK
jgi:excisionase family DNA binding protein